MPRVKPAEEAGAAGPACCTLRIRSESGEQTYEVRMLLTDTIGDLRQHLAHIRYSRTPSPPCLTLQDPRKGLLRPWSFKHQPELGDSPSPVPT